MEYYYSSVLSNIKEHYENFTSVEEKIGDFFLYNQEKIDFSSKAVSNKLYVSKASLSRFAQKCGYHGYKELRYQYEAAFRNYGETANQNTYKICRVYQELLIEICSNIDNKKLGQILKKIKCSERVLVCGKESSEFSVKETALRFMQEGFNVVMLTGTDMIKTQIARLDKTAMVIAFDFEGNDQDVFRLLQEANYKKAKTVLFTGGNTGNYKNLCSEIIELPTIDCIGYNYAGSLQISTLVMLDILFTEL
ncbi:MurR/RpiR family transcriptional regulator [Clostridium sp. AF19-22AC]|jgi:DNA-binding MurR/RpiR family transcriptional regulator|uniref:MurR/RpiR family transcriptional regulator n=1 Tax=Clostridia TaxID=186801 RepID=UPI000E4CD28A|nr:MULTISPECIES: MurR/RpiR family transcriptional regulator [Clostridia]RHR28167.1 MurR/RpiR family transcriptional regulator [Clostridium sp. AF19-22AC]